MPKFEEHIQQAEHNLEFLANINETIPNCIDWQITVCFYTALHLVNAHLSKFGHQYRKHTDVQHAINPEVQISPSKLPEDEYVAYTALQQLSRRSRYLVNEKDSKLKETAAARTYDTHLSKAIKHLDRLSHYFSVKYD